MGGTSTAWTDSVRGKSVSARPDELPWSVRFGFVLLRCDNCTFSNVRTFVKGKRSIGAFALMCAVRPCAGRAFVRRAVRSLARARTRRERSCGLSQCAGCRGVGGRTCVGSDEWQPRGSQTTFGVPANLSLEIPNQSRIIPRHGTATFPYL